MAVKSIIIKAGESAVLPKRAKIISVVSYNNATIVGGECLSLPVPEQAACYEVMYGVSNTTGPALEDATAYIAYIEILGVRYTAATLLASNIVAIENFITSNIPKSILRYEKTEVADTAPNFGARDLIRIVFKMSPVAAESMMIKLIGTGFENGAYVKPVPSTLCVVEGPVE